MFQAIILPKICWTDWNY